MIVVKDEENNPDIADHLGYWDITISISSRHDSYNEGHISATFRRHSVMFGSTYKVPFFNFLGYVQYWSGRGEGLVGYNRITTTWRLGAILDIM